MAFKEETYLQSIVHDKDTCVEFIVKSPKFSIKRWLLMSILFNVIGFTLQLHRQDSWIMITMIAFLLIVLVLKYHRKVKQESLLVMSSLGVQITTTFATGRTQSTFFDITEVKDIIINEAITLHKVIHYLALLLYRKENGKILYRVIPLFLRSCPSIKCLTKIYRGCQSILQVAQSSKFVHENVGQNKRKS